jgi:hypothetical protein
MAIITFLSEKRKRKMKTNNNKKNISVLFQKNEATKHCGD